MERQPLAGLDCESNLIWPNIKAGERLSDAGQPDAGAPLIAYFLSILSLKTIFREFLLQIKR